jgi:hypothetical protein
MFTIVVRSAAMSRQQLAASVLAVLVLAAGVVGVVAADPTAGALDASAQVADDSTDSEPTSADHGIGTTAADGDSPPIAPSSDGDDPYWLADLPAFLAEFEDVPADERAAFVAEVEAMRADGASVADVHHMLQYKLYGFGYDTAAAHRTAVEYRLEHEYGLTDEEAATVVDGFVEPARLGRLRLPDGQDRPVHVPPGSLCRRGGRRPPPPEQRAKRGATSGTPRVEDPPAVRSTTETRSVPIR